MSVFAFSTSCAVLLAALFGPPPQPAAEWLADTPGLIVHAQQAWGELGVNTCAHAAGQQPLPLRIKDTPYAKGLGSHANGEILLALDGRYTLFEAAVGVQWQQGNTGTVVFRVFVDGKKRFDSGVMHERDAAKLVRVPVAGAQELRLVASDAGDGITCDCADWADARLTVAPNAPPPPAETLFDIAPFARVVASDPGRTDGARANRVQEFHEEDLYLDRDVAPAADGTYLVAPGEPAKGVALGLRWFERRSLRSLSVEFAGAAPSADGARVEAWVGESPVQGRWVPLHCATVPEGGRWTATVDWQQDPDLRVGVRKVRWVVPAAAGPVSVRRLAALTPARLADVQVRLEVERAVPGERGEVEVYNGRVAGAPDAQRPATVAWDLTKPLRLSLQTVRTSPDRPDGTVLRVRLPKAAFGIAVRDLVQNECVYVKHAGLFAVREPSRLTVAVYRRRIAGRKTVLERVRAMPDQTFAQALAKTHHAAQDSGPMLLSLACDNRKFVAERDGTIRFERRPEDCDRNVNTPLQSSGALVPKLGTGAASASRTRRLDGGWLPAPVVEVKEGGVIYRERAYVAPSGPGGAPLCVVELTAENTGAKPAAAGVALTVLADAAAGKPAVLSEAGEGLVAMDGDRLVAAASGELGSLSMEQRDGTVKLTGDLPAGGSVHARVLVPGWPVPASDAASLPTGDQWPAFEAHWRSVMAPAVDIQVPDPFLSNVIRASQVHCLLAARNENGGERVAPWIAAVVYGPLESECNSIVRGMDMLGHHDFSRRALDYYVARYDPTGLLTTGYTLMGLGWHLQTLGEHYSLARDRDWLRRVAPDVERACAWIARQREKTKHMGPDGSKPPFYGLMPPGVIADWNAFAYYMCLNGYYFAGLQRAAEALQDVGALKDRNLLGGAAELRQCTLQAYTRTQAMAPVFPLQDGTWVPEYPSQIDCPGPTGTYFPGEDGNRSWCYDVEAGAQQLVPQGVLAPGDPEVGRMMDHLEDVQFLADGWFDYPADASHKDLFDLGGFSKVQPYYTRNAEIYALRDDVKPFIRSYFNTLAAMLNTEVLSLWEHFHASGAWNKTHETGYFLQQTRMMLVQERFDNLWLAPMVPQAWLADGKTISVANAPTQFGPVSYKVTSHAASGTIEAEVETPTRTAPHAIVVRLRHPDGKRMRGATVNGKPATDWSADGSWVRVFQPTGTVRIRAEYR